MHQWLILNLFLYFPEDKSEYIPAAITFVIFMVVTVLTFRLILRVSKKQEEKTKELEEEINRGRQQQIKS
ncbi:hypothetical protein [Jeotgalibacillus soli]|uniref:Uncharacterized protein n=1 Tax=Jeotgalibacillus soli TaxID=889306 RepID=A0A0C2QWZ6_9BACL|nr:hypothetical protein [Jeotgalibacillus soli]KIL42590.1 hypothetical protein KP78_38130 [Jeotgalibacillus soli]